MYKQQLFYHNNLFCWLSRPHAIVCSSIVINFDNPKSQIFTFPSLAMRMFVDFKSR